MAGYFTWNEEVAGSNPVCYTNWAVMYQGLAKGICSVFGRVRFPYGPHNWFVGVTAKIKDCLSVAMCSLPVGRQGCSYEPQMQHMH